MAGPLDYVNPPQQAGPLDYVNPPQQFGMDPFFLAGLGMLSQAGQPGAAGIGQGALQGMLAYSQMQGTEAQNELARRELELEAREAEARVSQASKWGDYVRSRPPEEQRMLEALGPEAGADYLAKLGVQAAKGAGGTWQGTGMQAQWMNTYNRLKPRYDAGEELSPTDLADLSYAFQKLTSPSYVTDAAGTVHTIPGISLPAPAGLVGGPALTGPRGAGAPGAPTLADTPEWASERPPTPTELKNRTYYNRMVSADAEMDALEAEGLTLWDLGPKTLRDYLGMRMKESPDVIQQVFGSMITSPEAAMYASAVGDYISGQLRYDSGAATPESEFSRYYTIYVPMPGEGPVVAAAKSRRRKSAAESLAAASGLSDEEYRKKALEQMEKDEKDIPLPQETPVVTPAAPAAPAAPAPGGEYPLTPSGNVAIPF